MWFSGPEFLKGGPEHWPIDISMATPISLCEIPEVRKQTQSFVLASSSELFPFSRFSSLTRLKRTTAYIIRFLNNCRKPKTQRQLGILSLNEINEAFCKLIKLSQQETFPDELSNLSKNNTVSKKSRILSLSPFLDEDKIMRVGGRLRHSPYMFHKKHPAVLSSKHRLTYLIVRYEHFKLLHSGPQSLLAAVRESFWPTSGSNQLQSNADTNLDYGEEDSKCKAETSDKHYRIYKPNRKKSKVKTENRQ
ncbi:hypothetical protein NQ314_000940 [Rhamnusium bicolor]|uniref:Uncharacterized protein n=1 Tax=Rhamnusium bicolor TaxID=1586634 RepID=A0AAV8ZTH1_9CUCU|nr:hypothetical protein NQ314_000940 [Rhamnusium bicolor]